MIILCIVVGSSLAVALGVYAVGDFLALRSSSDVRRRLQTVSGLGPEPAPTALVDDRHQGTIRRLLLRLGEHAEIEERAELRARGPTPNRRGGLRTMLIQAGFRRPDALALTRGIQVTAAAGLGAVALIACMAAAAGSRALVVIPLVGGALGFLAPQYVVTLRARRRSEAINRALPDVLDLLVLCVEAGLGLNAAVARVAAERGQRKEPIDFELAQLAHELRLGIPRREALRNLGERSGSEDLRAVSAQLIQADRLGASIAAALRAQAEAARTTRRIRAEEAANKMPVKIVFPLVLCIMPTLLALALLPPGLKFMEMVSRF